ncbi:MAG: hypothetical protein ABIE74_04600 [Pseudomonadota bacterium]
MKKFLVVACILAIGFSMNLFAGEQVKVIEKDGKTVEKVKWEEGSVKGKEKSVTTESGSVTKAKVKDTETGAKAKVKVTETDDATVTKEKAKGKAGSIKSTKVETAEGVAGVTKIHIKKGSIKSMQIDYEYYQQNNDYIIEYTIKDKTNKKLLSELNLTEDQSNMIQKGKHTIISTSPYTAGDVQSEFRDIILKDIQTAKK